jgi:hypothetical protein
MKKNQQKRFREILRILSQDVLSQFDIKKLKQAVNPNSCLSGPLKEIILNITKESSYAINGTQSVFAINWLKEKLFKKDGQLRKNTGPFGQREIEIITDFKEFKFQGFKAYEKVFYDNEISSGFSPRCEIIYKTIDKKGNFFLYTGVYFEQIEILN